MKQKTVNPGETPTFTAKYDYTGMIALHFRDSPQNVLLTVQNSLHGKSLLFGGLRRRWRRLGMVLSTVGYAVYCVWQFVIVGSWPDAFAVLLLAVNYLPLSGAAVWCHDRTGSVWTAVILHMVYNGVVLRAIL